jgi:2-keto-3-deoxy-L-rhamnonate aldolase RhmA
MLLKNQLKEKLLQGKQVIGTWIMTCGLENAEIMARAGLDYLMIDCEHGCMDVETAGRMVSLIRPTQTAPLLRVEWNRIETIKRGLDTGAYGIMIPFVNTKEEAEQAVSYCKYPVRGLRGNGLGRATTFGVDMEYMDVADQEVLVILQIEHYKAVENVHEILSVPGIDVAFAGPADMSTSMGLAGQLDHPDVITNCKVVVEACRQHNVIPGILCGTPGSIKRNLEMGYRFLLSGMDSMMLYNGCRQLLNEFQSFSE